jgi:hypothetical protein
MIYFSLFIAMIIGPRGFHDNPDYRMPGKVEMGIWKLTNSKGGVQSFVRWITDSKGTAIRERKGEMKVNCTLQQAVNLLSDAESTSKWMSGIDENYFLSKISQNEWYTYTLFSIPWPFSKRDMVSWCRMASDHSHGTVNIAMISKDKYMPLKSGITRRPIIGYLVIKAGRKNGKISFNVQSSAPLIY